ncbi:DNA-directed RNA polymerase, partial [Teratosphaeriaceae sp. CCFEE 6253]
PETLEEVLESEDYNDKEFTTLGPITQKYYDEGYEPEEKATEELAHVEQQQREPEPKAVPDSSILRRLPEVSPTAQKGFGLIGIHRAIKDLTDLPPASPDASQEEHRARAFERQRQMEETS